MDYWASNGSTNETVTTFPVPSLTAPVANYIVTPSVGLLGLYPEIMGAIYISLLAVVKLNLFIIRDACTKCMFISGTTIEFSFIASYHYYRNV